MTVGKYKGAKSPQALEGLVAVLLSCALINWCSRQLGLTTGDLASLVDEILQQIAFVLGQEQNFGLLDDTAKVGHKVAAFLGELG